MTNKLNIVKLTNIYNICNWHINNYYYLWKPIYIYIYIYIPIYTYTYML